VPSSQEAEKPSLRKETDGNSGGWECITIPFAVSGEDPEVWDGRFAERQSLDCQTSTTHRKQGNCVQEKASSTSGWSARSRLASEHLAANSGPAS
jgi:hypothetical protein